MALISTKGLQSWLPGRTFGRTTERTLPPVAVAGPPSFGEALQTLRALPPLSAVAGYLLQQVSQEGVSFRKVSDVIRTDAPISADMLRMANSALFGARFPVTGVLHALAMMGLDRVRSLITTVALKNLVGTAPGTPALLRCWRHNLASAFLAEELARKCGVDPDFAYTAGLLHDIGRLTMMSAWRQKYSMLLDSTEGDPALLVGLESREFAVSHTLAGMILLQDWKLPAVFCEIANKHHEKPAEGPPDVMAVVHFSCRFADVLGFSVLRQKCQEVEPDPPSPLRPLIPGTLCEIYLRLAERINGLECVLAK